MRALLAIAEREIRDRWLLLAGAALVGLLPWMLVPLDRTRMAPAAGGLVGTLLFGLAAAILTGWTVVGSDLSEGRLAFFFARPIPWWAIWGGKWLGGAALTLGSALVMWLIVVPLDHDAATKMGGWFLEGSVAVAGAGCLLFMAMSHVASIAFRSRSPLLALDLLLAAAASLTLFWFGLPLLVTGNLLGRSGWAVAGSVALVAWIFTLAGAVQVAVGRVDRRRGHRVMSAVLWSGIAILIAFVGLRSYHLTHPGIEGISDVFDVEAAPRGTWVELNSWVMGHRITTSFLLDSSNGRSLTRAVFPPPSDVAFSADGTRAVWLEATGPAVPFELLSDRLSWNQIVVARLEGASPSTSRQPLTVPVEYTGGENLALSPEGTRLAVASGATLDVFDVTSGKHLTGIPSAGGRWTGSPWFESNAVLRAYRTQGATRPRAPRTMTLLEVDSDTRSSATTLGTLHLDEGETITQVRDDGRLLARAVLYEPGGRAVQGSTRVEVHEMPSGRVLTSIAVPRGLLRDAYLLDDGRVAVLHDDGPQAPRLDLHSSNGALLWSLAFETKETGGSIGGVLPPDRLTVTTGLPFRPASTTVVSLSAGTILHSHPGMSVVEQRWWARPATSGPLAARLLKSADGGLALLDPEGKTTRTILPPSSGR